LGDDRTGGGGGTIDRAMGNNRIGSRGEMLELWLLWSRLGEGRQQSAEGGPCLARPMVEAREGSALVQRRLWSKLAEGRVERQGVDDGRCA